jgi:hypothetical protein
MANVIVIKKGAGVPAPDQLQEAELALDVTDGALYSKLQDGTIHHLNDGADGINLSDYVLEAPDDGVLYGRQSKDWVEVVIPDGGTGSSVHIGDTPPDSPQEGQQWMEVPADGDATMWIFDGANWLQQPGGKDGADGADGVDGLWTDEGNGSISYSGTARAAQLELDGTGSYNKLIMTHPEGGAKRGAKLAQDTAKFSVSIRDNTGAVSGGLAFDNETANATFDANLAYFNSVNDAAQVIVSSRNAGNEVISQTRYHTLNSGGGNTGGAIGHDGTSLCLTGATSLTAEKHLTIDASGNATFSGNLNVADTKITGSGKIWQIGHCGIRMSTIGGGGADTLCMIPVDANGLAQINQGFMDIGRSNYRFRDGYFSGNIYKNGSASPLINGTDLIKTLSAIRNATKDETTLEGMRDALSDAIGGLIQNLEHEISTMPVEDSE